MALEDKVLVFEFVTEGDTLPVIVEKTNRNFDMIKLFGGGDKGDKGDRGDRGVIGATGIGAKGDTGQDGSEIFFLNSIINDEDPVLIPDAKEGDVSIDSGGTYFQIEDDGVGGLIYKEKFSINTAALNLLVSTQRSYDDVSPSKPVNTWILKKDPSGELENNAVIAKKDDSGATNSVSEFYRLIVGDDRNLGSKSPSLIVTNLIPEGQASAKDGLFSQITLKYRESSQFTSSPTNEGNLVFKARNKTEASPVGPDDFYLLFENASVGFGLKHDSLNTNDSYALVRGKNIRFIGDLNFDGLYNSSGDIDNSGNFLNIDLTAPNITKLQTKQILEFRADHAFPRINSYVDTWAFYSVNVLTKILFTYFDDFNQNLNNNEWWVQNVGVWRVDVGGNATFNVTDDLDINARATRVNKNFVIENFMAVKSQVIEMSSVSAGGSNEITISSSDIKLSVGTNNDFLELNRVYIAPGFNPELGQRIKITAPDNTDVFIIQDNAPWILLTKGTPNNNVEADFNNVIGGQSFSVASTLEDFVILRAGQSMDFRVFVVPSGNNVVLERISDTPEFGHKYKVGLETQRWGIIDPVETPNSDAWIDPGDTTKIIIRANTNKLILSDAAKGIMTASNPTPLPDVEPVGSNTVYKFLRSIQPVTPSLFPLDTEITIDFGNPTLGTFGSQVYTHTYMQGSITWGIDPSFMGANDPFTPFGMKLIGKTTFRINSNRDGWNIVGMEDTAIKLLGQSYNAYEYYTGLLNETTGEIGSLPDPEDSDRYLSDHWPIQAAIAKHDKILKRYEKIVNHSRGTLQNSFTLPDVNFWNSGTEIDVHTETLFPGGATERYTLMYFWVFHVTTYHGDGGKNTSAQFNLKTNGAINSVGYYYRSWGSDGFDSRGYTLVNVETVDIGETKNIQLTRRKVYGGTIRGLSSQSVHWVAIPTPNVADYPIVK